MAKKRRYQYGETFENPYLGNTITEVLDMDKQRIGWIWKTSDGSIIVSPHLGFYIWFDEGGEKWTKQSGSLWLVRNRPTKKRIT
jgi:hypothetical protein